jgi:hypothetical protein
MAHRYQAIGFGEWQWRENDRIQQGENRRVSAYPKCKRQYGNRGETRRAAQRAQRHTKVLQYVFHETA